MQDAVPYVDVRRVQGTDVIELIVNRQNDVVFASGIKGPEHNLGFSWLVCRFERVQLNADWLLYVLQHLLQLKKAPHTHLLFKNEQFSQVSLKM